MYNGKPYVTHPARVAGRTCVHKLATEEMVAAAYLHDVVEDTWVTPETLSTLFPPGVVELVNELTNPSKGMKASRKVRKETDRAHLTEVSVRG